jgi:predicted dehydrogenase
MNRRDFAITTSTALAAPAVLAAPARRRVCVIGHTGRGNFGHGLDTVWLKLPETQIVGVADANAGGLKKAIKKLKLREGYSDYRKMLAELKPEFVSVAPRHADQHFDMCMAAIDNGARGIYIEKPFCRSPEAADKLIAAAKKSGVKIAVAHRNRYHPTLPVVKKLIDDGKIGKLLFMAGQGVGDRRGGGEDLWVLGSHVFNLYHYFAGKPQSCSAVMLKDGKKVTQADVYDGAEGLGPLAGNELHARWHMQNGVMATYSTIANDGTDRKAYGLHLTGTKGYISIYIDKDPLAWYVERSPFVSHAELPKRTPITAAGVGKAEPDKDKVATVHNHVIAVRDLLEAVDKDRAPLCDAAQGAVTVEMICSVFASHVNGGAEVSLPLKARSNALAGW